MLPIQLEIIVYPMTTGIFAALLGVIFLLIGSGLVSGSEVAFFSLGPSDKNVLREKGSGSSNLVLKLLKTPERLLATILITNNFINVAIIIISAFILNTTIDITGSRWLEFLIQVVIVSFILLLFGEILPKLYANLYAVSFSLFMSYPLEISRRIFYPLSSILIRSTSMVKKRLQKKRQNLSMDQLSDAIDLTADDIMEEKTMLEGIIRFGNIDVREIMKSRIDVVALEMRTKLDELIRVINESGYSRIPIYSENFDNIKGVLYIKDVLPHLNKSNKFKWQSLIRPPYYVPENKKINDLLHEFQAKKMHMAIVVDEYGGTSGIITLEDILEEIVGEITDESDEAEIPYRRIDKNTFIFKGKTSLHDFYKLTRLSGDTFDPVRGDADTLAGLILEMKGEIPALGTIISYGHLDFHIESVDRRRIKEIKVVIGQTGKSKEITGNRRQ